MVSVPRLVVAAPASGHGKTTVATGLMSALRRAGHTVSGHKIGPDFIDPGYHALATGRPGRNLDPHLVGEQRIGPLLAHGARGVDIAVIEGVMGLYDGQIGSDGFASTAHIAALTDSPVVLVVDISHAARSVAAVVQGMIDFDRSVRVAGVILNKAGSTRHSDEVIRSLEPLGVDVLGVLPRDAGIVAPSRHLGLVPAAEREDAVRALDRLAEQITERVDLGRIATLSRSAPGLDVEPWDPAQALEGRSFDGRAGEARAGGRPPVVAVAGGRAFTFRYAETTELLRAAGCEVVEFDPMSDRRLPEGTSGIYLGGGFPEVHAAALGANEPMLGHIRTAVERDVPIVAECAGMLYLCRSVDAVPMVGAIDADARMTTRLTLAYRTAETVANSCLGPAGEAVTAHEFHRTRIDPATSGATPAWTVDGAPVGFATPTLHASYLHTHWAGFPQLAAAFAQKAAAAEPVRAGHALRVEPVRAGHAPVPRIETVGATGGPGPAAAGSSSPPESPVITDPMRHHGDVEASGLVDFAVNVFDGPRPEWLEIALEDSLAESSRYPDPDAATRAVAQRHGRPPGEVLATAGAAEAFGLIARLRQWRRPVVVHPQFTEPDVALATAGHRPEHVLVDPGGDFALDPELVPSDADLVVVGNPTNPTGVLHPADAIRLLLRPGRVVVVDEAFMDFVPGERASLAEYVLPGVLVIRSLTKMWSVPGLRAGYVLGEASLLDGLRELQAPWSVSTPALAVLRACSTDIARAETARRSSVIARDRAVLTAGLTELGVPFVPDPAGPFVLARPGRGVHSALRRAGYAVRRADTFPGLDDDWIRIAVRPPETTRELLGRLRHASTAEA